MGFGTHPDVAVCLVVCRCPRCRAKRGGLVLSLPFPRRARKKASTLVPAADWGKNPSSLSGWLPDAGASRTWPPGMGVSVLLRVTALPYTAEAALQSTQDHYTALRAGAFYKSAETARRLGEGASGEKPGTGHQATARSEALGIRHLALGIGSERQAPGIGQRQRR